ncbi:hypothetical protein PAAG_12639 [Paracoccidioides lutzii Pb01]|uniref:Uncharacterized protein n=1 Tax=Paracoccidioides lutzii (strain ATCC MYA-826 / Pb01) TaxID=502779 RepID=A0A0A2UYS6_PARBA|nr:hypothetical protein PAAG_12639 [Paracoccidioides lutzii Pb01]KGQ00706.1 hypothetical protein PAAG_12639 [Paracoccidioides lutzii Pb01]
MKYLVEASDSDVFILRPVDHYARHLITPVAHYTRSSLRPSSTITLVFHYARHASALTSSPDSTANAGVWMSHQSRKRLPPHQGIVQRRRGRIQCLFHKIVDGNEAQVLYF